MLNGLTNSLRRAQVAKRRDHLAKGLVSVFLFFYLLTGHWPLVTGHDTASADIPRTIAYQGKLTELNGVPLTGEHVLTLRLFGAVTGGT